MHLRGPTSRLERSYAARRYIYISKYSEAAESLLEPSGNICGSEGDQKRRRKAPKSITAITICKIPSKSRHWKSRRDIWIQSQTARTGARATFSDPTKSDVDRKQIPKEAITRTRKLSRQDPHHMREEIFHGSHVMRIRNFFLSVFRIMCAWALSFPQMPRVMCAGSFTTFSRLRQRRHKIRSRPARSCTTDHDPPRPDPRGARGTSSLWRAKVRGSRRPV